MFVEETNACIFKAAIKGDKKEVQALVIKACEAYVFDINYKVVTNNETFTIREYYKTMNDPKMVAFLDEHSKLQNDSIVHEEVMQSLQQPEEFSPNDIIGDQHHQDL